MSNKVGNGVIENQDTPAPIIQLARHDERITNLERSQTIQSEALLRLDGRVADIDRKLEDRFRHSNDRIDRKLESMIDSLSRAQRERDKRDEAREQEVDGKFDRLNWLLISSLATALSVLALQLIT